MENSIKQILRSPLLVLSIIIGLLYLGIFIRFVLIFGNNGLSDTPNDWYEFVEMSTGIIGLIITGLIAWQIHSLNIRSTSKYAKLPYTIKAYDRFVELTLGYMDKRDKIVGYKADLLSITNEYLEKLSKFIYFECIYFDLQINKDLNDYKKSMNIYLQWLKDIGNTQISHLDFVCDHSNKTNEVYFIYDDITKKMQEYIID
jgi:hypothetical protein